MFHFRFIARDQRASFRFQRLVGGVIVCADHRAGCEEYCADEVAESEGDLVRFTVAPAADGAECVACHFERNN